MRKLLIFFGFITGIFLFFSSIKYYVRAQSAGTDPNLLPNITKSCITVSGEAISGQGARFEEDGKYDVTLSGECLSSTPCDILSCYAPKIGQGNDAVADPDPTHAVCSTRVTGLTQEQVAALDNKYLQNGGANMADPKISTVELKSRATTLPPGPFSVPAIITAYPGGLFGENDGEDEGNERARDFRRRGLHSYSNFFAMGDGEVTELGTGGDGEVDPTSVMGDERSQQLGQGSFDAVTPTTTTIITEGADKSCALIYWDPYGIVFDSDSLEPLNSAMAIVTLLDEGGKQIKSAVSTRVAIDILGKYNIYVEKDGKYKLDVSSTTHNFVSNKPIAAYINLYESIFLPGDPAFEEKSTEPKRVDLPLKSKGIPYTRKVAEYYKSQTEVLFGGKVYESVEIRVTHPLSKIRVLTDGREITSQMNGLKFDNITDKNGVWTGMIRRDLISNKGLTIEVTKNNNYFTYQSSGSNEKLIIHFDPILTYVEGYAYNGKNQIIPGAKVEVKLKMNDKTLYQTTADSNGFFNISPKNLSLFEYYFRFTDPVTKSTVAQTTAGFVKNNQEYLESEKIDLINVTKNNKPIISQKNNNLSNSGLFDNQPVNSLKKGIDTVATKNNTSPINVTIIIMLMILLLLVSVTVGLIFYIKKNR
ncbi:MAG: hypothetical protein AAB788_01220 [Patescibacteria group bacterium]